MNSKKRRIKSKKKQINIDKQYVKRFKNQLIIELNKAITKKVKQARKSHVIALSNKNLNLYSIKLIYYYYKSHLNQTNKKEILLANILPSSVFFNSKLIHKGYFSCDLGHFTKRRLKNIFEYFSIDLHDYFNPSIYGITFTNDCVKIQKKED